MKNQETDFSFHESKDMDLFNSISKSYCDKDIQKQSSIARKYRLTSSLEKAFVKSDARILEVGCGAGFSVQYLDIDYKEYAGVDYSSGLIDYAKTYNSNTRASFICANIKDFNPDQKFDVIFMIGVLHHFDDMDSVMMHLHNLLSEGGVIIANEPQSSNPLIQLLRKSRGKLDKGYSLDQIQFSPNSLEEVFKRNQLNNVQTFSQGIFSTPFAEVIIKPKVIAIPLSKIAVFFDKNIEKHFSKLLKWLSWNLIVIGRK
jgi:SAM-dependent methyltransferase